MEELKKIYDNFFIEENKPLRIAFSVFIFLLISILISVFFISKRYNKTSQYRNFQRPYYPENSYRIPQRTIPYVKPVPITRNINPPDENEGYLIRKKTGYSEQSPKKKNYPAKFKISSVLR